MQRIFLYSILILTLAGCTDIIEVDTPEGEPQIIIDGNITDERGAQVRIQSSVPFFEEGELPLITDAEVTLYENGQPLEMLQHTDTADGWYVGSTPGTLGNTYELEIRIPEDNPHLPAKNWRCHPERLNRVFELDSSKTKFLGPNTTPQAFEDGVYGLTYFREPPGLGDRYRMKRTLNDSVFQRDLFLLTDENVDGFYFGGNAPAFNVYGIFEEGDTLKLEFLSLSDAHYGYLQRIAEQSGGSNLFDPPPAPLFGNFYNMDDPDELGFGFFGASAVERDTIIYNP